jgi:hypothetical protein
MRKRLFVPFALIAAVLLLAAGLFAGARGTIAQDMASPAADAGHPAHIHEGTCDTLGGVVFPLNNLMAPDMSATPMAGDDMGGMDMASPMAGMSGSDPMADVDLSQVAAWSKTDVEASLDTILGAEHAINVHESVENIQNYVSCGEVTGSPTDGMLEITMNELNGSGLSGTAVLQDNGDGTTTVTVWLMHGGMMGTPEAEASPSM